MSQITQDFSIKEVASVVISLAIAGVSLWMLTDSYISSKAAETDQAIAALGRQKDILLLGLGLLGTVIGYYFGRLPAEREADAARQQATEATEKTADANGRVEAAVNVVTSAIVELDNATGGAPTNSARQVLVDAEQRLRLLQ